MEEVDQDKDEREGKWGELKGNGECNSSGNSKEKITLPSLSGLLEKVEGLEGLESRKLRSEEEEEKVRINQGSLTPADSSLEEDSDEERKSNLGRSRSESSVSEVDEENVAYRRVSQQEQEDRARREAERIQNYGSGSVTLANLIVNVFSILGSVFIFGVFLVGSYDYFKNVESNKCSMTWMYQVPKYVPLKIGAGVDEKLPLYKLYAYAEGERAFEVMSRDTYKFTGIPVLFIPGNAGSYQQVRSLASVALWKQIDGGGPFHFDFFSVDLNEEFSALYGYSLQKQVEFVKEAMVKIVNLYEEFHKVVLVGHSMGGIIAKTVALDEEGGNLANLIVTLATPHKKPVLILDPELDMFYYAVSRNWTKMRKERQQVIDSQSESSALAASPTPVTLVSIAGGDRDYLVPPGLTRWNPFTNLHTITTGVPGVWASTDHLCIVWCKQLVLTLTRALFDLVEFHQRNKYYFITEKEENRRDILNYHLIQRSSGKSWHGSKSSSSGAPIYLTKSIEQIHEEFGGVFCRSSGERPVYVLYPLGKNGNNHDNLVVLSTNVKDKHWLMGCTVYSEELKTCLEVESLAAQGKIIPHLRRRRKMAKLSISSLSSYSYLVVKMEPYQFKTCLMLETFRSEERSLLVGSSIISNGKIYFNLTIPLEPGFGSLLAWKVEARPVGNNCLHSPNLLGQFTHGNFQQTKFLKNESIVVRFSDWNVTGGNVELFLEPSCNYTVITKLALMESAGQVFRMLWKFLPSFYASVILMTLYFQKDPENWSSFHLVLLSNSYHLSVLPGFCVAVLLNFVPTDWPLMIDAQEYTVLVPIICYMIAYTLVLCISSGTWYTFITGGTAIHSVVLRLLSSRFGSWFPRLLSNRRGFSSVTEHVTEAAFEMTLTRFPLTIAILLVALSFATCGSLGIFVAAILYLVKLFKIYEDLLEDLLKAKIANVKDSLSPMNFHFSCFMLWVVMAALNVASLMHWTRSGKVGGIGGEQEPQWDLSMYLCMLLLPTVAVLWQEFCPKMEPFIWNIHRYIFYGVGVATVLWGTHRLYVTAFLITFVFLTMSVCQLVSVVMSTITQQQEQAQRQQNSQQNHQQPPQQPAESPGQGIDPPRPRESAGVAS